MTRKSLGIVGWLLLASLTTAQPALAQNQPPIIRSVRADVLVGTLVIRGRRFGDTQGNSRAGIGMPDGSIFTLTIIDWRRGKIEAILPLPDLFPDPPTFNRTYKVVVQTGREIRAKPPPGRDGREDQPR